MILPLDKVGAPVAKEDSIRFMVHLEEGMQAEESNSSISFSKVKVDSVDHRTTSKASSFTLANIGRNCADLAFLLARRVM